MSRSPKKASGADARTVASIDELPQPSAALLDELVMELGLAGHRAVPEIKHRLMAHAQSFAMGRFLQSRFPTVHEDAKRMGEIRDAIDKLEGAIGGLSVFNLMPLEMAFEQRSKGEKRLSELRRDLALLRELTAKISDFRFARKQPDAVLKNAVGCLMRFLEGLTGHRAAVTRRSSDSGIEPKLSSPEAAAIGKLLRVAQPDLQTTTLVNMIARIRREAGDGPLTAFEHEVILGGTVRPF